MTSNKTEIHIIRNALSKMLYDVVLVDFVKEDVSYVAKAKTFEEAQGIVVEYEEQINNEEVEEV